MALEDFLEPEIAVTAAVAAAVFSPKGRRLLRRGVVYGLSGVLVAGDAVTALSRNVGHGLQSVGTSAAQATRNLTQQAKAGAEEASGKAAAGHEQTASSDGTGNASAENPS
ncbi:MAG TPA: hypothetical protein VHZ51_15130 [Ktedonobacteraceae bacterium]|nr:hypothetical protein [Ktedonobacteraceae bacterium]